MQAFMPPKTETPLTPEEVALIKIWIDEGARAPKGPGVIPKVIVVGVPPANVTPVRAQPACTPSSSARCSCGDAVMK